MEVKLMLVATLAFLASTSYGMKSYEGYEMVKVSTLNRENAEVLINILEDDNIDVFVQPSIGGYAEIMLSPEEQVTVKAKLDVNGFDYTVSISNLQTLIDLEKIPSTKDFTIGRSDDHPMTWDAYHDIDDIEAYTTYLAKKYPDTVSLESIGKSHEGRDMRVIKICSSGTCGDKPAMWIDGGIHAREWITPATATFIARELIENADKHQDILQELDWYILPLHNPDGYVYSWQKDRMWRKSRTCYDGDRCCGTDLNRNWDFKYEGPGSSTSSCSQTYRGPKAFSESEAANVAKFIETHKDTIKFYNGIHSFSQLILTPWGYTKTPPKDDKKIQALAEKGYAALKAVHGTKYVIGCPPCTLYVVSGSSLDWMKGVLDIPYPFNMELRPTSMAEGGFALPADQIIPTGEETFAFHDAAANEIIKEFS